MIQMRTAILAAFLLIMSSAVPNVYAHRPDPGKDEGVTQIPDPATSYAFYREIVSPEQIHIYEFQSEAGQFFHAGINVPQIKGLEDFGVTLALLGPGLPPIAEHQLHSYGASLQLGASGGLAVESTKAGDFYEPFTQTRYWGRQELELNLPESGTYRLLIWNPKGESGKYVLDTGTEEVFGPADMLRFPLWWIHARVYFEQTPQLIGTSIVLLSAALGFVMYRRGRTRLPADSMTDPRV